MNHRPTDPSHTVPAVCTMVYALPLAYSLASLQDVIANPLEFSSTERPWEIVRCLAILIFSTIGYAYVWVDWNRRRRKYREAIANLSTEVIAPAGVWPPPPQGEVIEQTDSSTQYIAAPTLPIITRLVIGGCSTIVVLSAVNVLGLVLAVRHGFPVPTSAFAPSLIIGFVFTLGAIKIWADWQKKVREQQRNLENDLGTHDL